MCPRRCLECRNHAKNLINGKISFFYIEAISQKNSQLRKKTFPKIIFFGTKKFPENVHPQKISCFCRRKSANFEFQILSFSILVELFSKNIFSKMLFLIDRKKSDFFDFFSELRKKCWYSFDVRLRKFRSFDLWCFQLILSTANPIYRVPKAATPVGLVFLMDLQQVGWTTPA